MIFNLDLGVGKFSTINVTAPSGTTVTCVQSPYSFSKSTGSGTSVSFVVPKSGNWTISGTLDGTTKTSTVSVTTYGGTYSVQLVFYYWLFKEGEGAKVGLTAYNPPGDKITSDKISFQFRIYTDSAIDLSKYSTMWIEGKRTLSGNSGIKLYLDKVSDSGTPFATIPVTTTRASHSVDISSIATSKKLFLVWDLSGYSEIYNWYLAP